jgi:hypothetical protein
MILLRLLDHDLHRSRANIQAVPLWIETPAKPAFIPAVISGSGMDVPEKRFLVSRKLTQDGKLRSGVFKYDSDRVDELIGDMMKAAYELSIKENWPNIFRGKKQLESAFGYVQKSAGVTSQPHMVLVPEGKAVAAFNKAAGKHLVEGVYRNVCRVTPSKVEFPIFCSRPDYVGMYTQFVGGRSSIMMHNIRNGLAFCPPD